MPSAEQICSFATTLLKRAPVTDINDSTVEATACLAVFDFLRDQLLEMFAWTFATKRVQLQQSATAPIYQYNYLYVIPADCLMPLEARADTWVGDEFRWVVEQEGILTNAETVYLKYTQRVTATGLYTPSFALALSHSIAGTLAYSMTGKAALADALMKASASIAAQAQQREGQKGTQDQSLNADDSWVRARNSASLRFDRDTGWSRYGQ